MYHDNFAKFDKSAIAGARALALAGADKNAVAAKTIDEVVDKAASEQQADRVDETVAPHPMAKVDPREIAFQVLNADAGDENERAFIAGMKRLSFANTPIPWSVRGPSLAAVIAFVGVEPSDEYARDRFAILLGRAIHLLTPAEGRGSNRRARRSGAATFIGKVRMKLDELPFGTPIPRWSRSERVSKIGLAEMLDLPRGKFCACTRNVDEEVHSRLKDGRLRLGAPYIEGAAWRKALRPARERLIAVIQDRAAEGRRRPIEIAPLSRRKVLLDPLLDEAGVRDEKIRDALWSDQKVRAVLARVTAIVGTTTAGSVPQEEAVLTFDELLPAGATAAEERFRSRNPEASQKAAEKAGKDELSYLRRAMRLNGWEGATDVAASLLGPDSKPAIDKGLSQNVRSDRTYLASIAGWQSMAQNMITVRSGGQSFSERLRAGLRRLMMSSKSFCDRYDIPYDGYRRWMANIGLPTSHQLHYVYRIEKAFGAPRGELVGLLGVVRVGRNNTGRKTIVLSDGRTVELKKYLRFLPADAIDWSEDRLRSAVEEADRRHYSTMTVNIVRQRAVAKLTRDKQPLDPACPILEEWQDLKAFKTSMCDGERYISPKFEWKSTRTVELNRQHMMGFARWCAMPVSDGGLGLPARQISFVLFLNPQVVFKYIFYRVQRFAHLTVDGREIGPILSGTEAHFLMFVKSMLDSDSGWLPQSRDRIKRPEIIDVEFPLETMSVVDNKMTVVLGDDPQMCRVMDAALVASIEADWADAARRARRMVASLAGKTERHYRMIRDPHKLVWPIINHDYPIAVVLRQVKDALDRVRPIEVCPMQHAKDYRNAVAILMLVTVAFRSDTLRNMEWRSDGSGQLVRTASGYDVIVGADRFKNGHCEWLFGPSYRRRDYERGLGDWHSLTKILDYYIEVCRPILLKGRTSDLLFPTGGRSQKWSSSAFSVMITDWTRMWSVRNERTKTGMSGVMAWGPHTIRDIVATHIILHYPGEGRWEVASGILGASVQVVKKHYAFVNAKKELAKSDPLYAEAFRLGFGEEDVTAPRG